MPATDNKTVIDNRPEHLTPGMPSYRLFKSLPVLSSQECTIQRFRFMTVILL